MENYTKEKEVTEEKSVDVDQISKVYIEKTQSLLGKANDSFEGLCRTLEMEQNKLAELEQRRIKLQEEMKKLRLEIEDERRFFEEDLEKVTRKHTIENKLPDPVDVTNFHIELKSEFMREFLAKQTRELQAENSKISSEDLRNDTDGNNNDGTNENLIDAAETVITDSESTHNVNV